MASESSSLLPCKVFVLITLAIYSVHCDNLCDTEQERQTLTCICDNEFYRCFILNQTALDVWSFPNETHGINFFIVNVGNTRFYLSPSHLISALTHLLKSFEIMSFNLTKLDTNFMQDKPLLKTIDLNNCEINSIETGAFNNLPNLSVVNIHNSGVKYLRPFMFNNTGTEELTLGGNLIDEIDTNAFSGLKFLTLLKLDSNNIQTIQSGTFRGLPMLKELNLKNNKIISIANNAFISNPNLKFIDLSWNPLESINLNIFVRQSNLALNISAGQLSKVLSTVRPRRFAKLILRDNSIETIPNVRHELAYDLNLNGKLHYLSCAHI